MEWYERSESFSEVQHRLVGGVNDKYVRCGTNVMVRKFDPTVISPASWNEVWIGFRWRISSSYEFTTQSVAGTKIDPFGSYGEMEFGLCRTDGTVFGQSGSFAEQSLQHTYGYRKTDAGSSGTTYWELHTSGSGPYTLASGGGIMIQRVTGSGMNTTGKVSNIFGASGRTFCTFTNTSYFTGSYRSLYILRIATSSLNPNSLKGEVITPSVAISSSYNDISSSAQLADIMSSDTWEALAATASSRHGYIDSGLSSAMVVSQSLHGNFDGVFVSWRRLYDNLEISDIVVRKK